MPKIFLSLLRMIRIICLILHSWCLIIYQRLLNVFVRVFAPLQFRFFACGEYGSRTLRPHYHVVLFGLPCNAEVERQVLSAWGAGHVSISQLSPARASYVAKYVCKDISDDDKLPEGYQREFARMSRNPGIGAGFIVAAADAVNRANRKQRQHGFPDITDLVKGSMRIGPVYYPTRSLSSYESGRPELTRRSGRSCLWLVSGRRSPAIVVILSCVPTIRFVISDV